MGRDRFRLCDFEYGTHADYIESTQRFLPQLIACC